MNNFEYTVSTKKSFNEAVRSVEEETKKAGFRVLHIHDVAATLAEKNFQIEPFKIIEICNAKSAYAVLQADIKIGLCLPCKINVYVKNKPASAKASAGKQTFISGMRPIVLSQFFPKANLGNLPIEIDQIIQNIINKAK